LNACFWYRVEEQISLALALAQKVTFVIMRCAANYKIFNSDNSISKAHYIDAKSLILQIISKIRFKYFENFDKKF